MAHYTNDIFGAAELFQRGRKELAVERLIYILINAAFDAGVNHADHAKYVAARDREVFVHKCIHFAMDSIREDKSK